MSARSLGVFLNYGSPLRIQLSRFQVCFYNRDEKRREIMSKAPYRVAIFERIPLRHYDLLDVELTRLSLGAHIFSVKFSGPVKKPNPCGTYSLYLEQISLVFSKLRGTLKEIMESHGIDRDGTMGLNTRDFESSIQRTPRNFISAQIPEAAVDEVLKRPSNSPRWWGLLLVSL